MTNNFDLFTKNQTDTTEQKFELADEKQRAQAENYMRAALAKTFEPFEKHYGCDPKTAKAFKDMLGKAPEAIIRQYSQNKNISTTYMSKLAQDALNVWSYFEAKMQAEVAQDPKADTAYPPLAFCCAMGNAGAALTIRSKTVLAKLAVLENPDPKRNPYANYFGWRSVLELLSNQAFASIATDTFFEQITDLAPVLGTYGLDVTEIFKNKSAIIMRPSNIAANLAGHFAWLQDSLELVQGTAETPGSFLRRQQHAFGQSLAKNGMSLSEQSPQTVQQRAFLASELCTSIDPSTDQAPWLCEETVKKIGLANNRVLGNSPINLATKATLGQVLVEWGGLDPNWQTKSAADKILSLSEPSLLVRAWCLHRFGPQFFDAYGNTNINQAYQNPIAYLAEAKQAQYTPAKGGQQPANLKRWRESLWGSASTSQSNPAAKQNSIKLKQYALVGRLLFLQSQDNALLPVDLCPDRKLDEALEAEQVEQAMGKLAAWALLDNDFTAQLQQTLVDMGAPLQITLTTIAKAQQAYNTAAPTVVGDDDKAPSIFEISPNYPHIAAVHDHMADMTDKKQSGIASMVKAKKAPKLA